ncbi:MAG: hypothetical protein QW666_02335 [Candidatus Woesearchaeota archaeon]
MLKITTKKENPLIGRIEIKGELAFQGATPSNDAVQKEIAECMKVDPSVVKVKSIYTAYGETKAVVTAHVYNSKEDLERFEPKKKEPKAKKAEEAKPEEKKEEKK